MNQTSNKRKMKLKIGGKRNCKEVGGRKYARKGYTVGNKVWWPTHGANRADYEG